jgi:membrane carboxypeptidase/penicillin-binding protein
MKLAGSITFLALLVLSVIAGSLTGLMLVYSVDLPQIADLERYRPITSTDLLDVHGRVFGSFALERRIVVPYEAIPPILRQAVISIEDKNFESHWGVNIFRVLGAAYHDLTSNGRTQGASTLTMQLARNLFLSSQQTFGRKLQEVFLSIQIERAFTKQQIFTLYANQIYLGQGVYGFEAGSEYYFSKHARDLTLPSRPAGRFAQGPGSLFSPGESRSRLPAAQHGDQLHAGRRSDYQCASQRSQSGAAWFAYRAALQQRRSVVRRRRAPRTGASIWQRAGA